MILRYRIHDESEDIWIQFLSLFCPVLAILSKTFVFSQLFCFLNYKVRVIFFPLFFFPSFIICQFRLYWFLARGLIFFAALLLVYLFIIIIVLCIVEQQQILLILFEKWVVASYSTWNIVVLMILEFQKYFDQTVTRKHKALQLLW